MKRGRTQSTCVKATVIKATEQNTVSSEAETVQKRETVQEVADDRT